MSEILTCSDTEKILVTKGTVTEVIWGEEVLASWK